MEKYLIVSASLSFIIALCQVLSLGKLIRLWQHKKLHPEASLKDIENFEKNTKRSYNFNLKKTESNKS